MSITPASHHAWLNRSVPGTCRAMSEHLACPPGEPAPSARPQAFTQFLLPSVLPSPLQPFRPAPPGGRSGTPFHIFKYNARRYFAPVSVPLQGSHLLNDCFLKKLHTWRFAVCAVNCTGFWQKPSSPCPQRQFYTEELPQLEKPLCFSCLTSFLLPQP